MLYKHIIQVENKNGGAQTYHIIQVENKNGGGHKHTIAPQ